MRQTSKIYSIALALGIAYGFCAQVMAQSSNTGAHQFHASGQSIPATLTAPVCLEGCKLATSSVTVDYLVVANTDTASHTVTVQDCGVPAFILLNAYPIAAQTTWSVPMGGSRMQGCLKWSATGLSFTDLVIDGTLNTKVTSASHTFTSIDVGRVVAVTAGTGFTPGNYTIASVSSGAAIMANAVGTTGSTGGTWAMSVVMGTIVGGR